MAGRQQLTNEKYIRYSLICVFCPSVAIDNKTLIVLALISINYVAYCFIMSYFGFIITVEIVSVEDADAMTFSKRFLESNIITNHI